MDTPVLHISTSMKSMTSDVAFTIYSHTYNFPHNVISAQESICCGNPHEKETLTLQFAKRCMCKEGLLHTSIR